MKCSWGSIVARSTLLEVTVWCRQATAHYLAWYWPQNMMLYGVIMPQWLKFSNCIMEKERTMPCNRFIISDQSCPPYRVCQVFSSKEMRGNSSNVYLLVLALSDSMYLVSVFLTKVLPLLRCLHFNDAEEADIYNKIDFICKVSYQLQHSLCHRCHHNEVMRYKIVEVCTYLFVLCYDVVIFRGLRPGWRGLLSKCTRTRANMKCQSWGHKAEGLDVPFAQTRKHCDNKPRQPGLNHDWNMTFFNFNPWILIFALKMSIHCSKRELLQLLRHVVAIIDGNCRLIMHVVKGSGVHDSLPETSWDLGVYMR